MDEPSAAILIEYVKPTNPAHEQLYETVRQRRVLEQFQEILSIVHPARTLTLSFTGCNGESNAYYDSRKTLILFCYEFLAEIRNAALTSHQRDSFVPLQDAIEGPVIFFMLHEVGHAVFDLFAVPVLGKEEDAADRFATIMLIKAGKELSMRVLRGTAWAYAHDARSRELDQSDFADIHSLDSQRYYDVLCLAYGSDPEYFAEAVTIGKLPKERATWCRREYHQAVYAIQKLIAPEVDPRKLERIRSTNPVLK